MAFQDYYNVAFNGIRKKRSDAALKRYESVYDPRSYSTDKFERAAFVLEIVKRGNSIDGSDASDSSAGSVSQQELIKKIEELNKELRVCSQNSHNDIFYQWRFVLGKGCGTRQDA